LRTLLIDGDILVVSTGAAHEVETDWGDDNWTLHCDVKEVKASILKAVENMKRELDADDAILTLSMGETFRHRLSPSYKAGRGRKPVGTGEVKRWLIEEQGAKFKPGIEADDTMGILATHPKLIKGEKIIVSQDKDMLTIPGKLYRNGEIVEVSEGEARYNWMMQTLTGDVTDGYPGLKGMGPVKAQKVLDKVEPGEDLWPAVVAAYEKAGMTEEDALLQARLARILHHTDYDFKKQEAILWHP
jgi:DNA polymerase-1